jgi:hypothetical protein
MTQAKQQHAVHIYSYCADGVRPPSGNGTSNKQTNNVSERTGRVNWRLIGDIGGGLITVREANWQTLV